MSSIADPLGPNGMLHHEIDGTSVEPTLMREHLTNPPPMARSTSVTDTDGNSGWVPIDDTLRPPWQ
jgi:hypothetical protein